MVGVTAPVCVGLRHGWRYVVVVVLIVDVVFAVAVVVVVQEGNHNVNPHSPDVANHTINQITQFEENIPIHLTGSGS